MVGVLRKDNVDDGFGSFRTPHRPAAISAHRLIRLHVLYRKIAYTLQLFEHIQSVFCTEVLGKNLFPKLFVSGWLSSASRQLPDKLHSVVD